MLQLPLLQQRELQEKVLFILRNLSRLPARLVLPRVSHHALEVRVTLNTNVISWLAQPARVQELQKPPAILQERRLIIIRLLLVVGQPQGVEDRQGLLSILHLFLGSHRQGDICLFLLLRLRLPLLGVEVGLASVLVYRTSLLACLTRIAFSRRRYNNQARQEGVVQVALQTPQAVGR